MRRGYLEAQTYENTRRLNAINGQMGEIREDVSKLREESAASHARWGVLVLGASLLGSGIGAALLNFVLHH